MHRFQLGAWDRQTDRQTDGRINGRVAALHNVPLPGGRAQQPETETDFIEHTCSLERLNC